MKTTFYIIRHGQSHANVSKRKSKPQKHLMKWGSRLSTEGVKQAQKIAELLKDKPFDAIYSSALTRSKQTAKIIAKKHTLPVSERKELHEHFYGTTYFSLPKAERKALRAAVREFEDDMSKLNHRFSDDGESAMESATRVKNVVLELAKKHQGQTVVIVAHASIMRKFLVLIEWGQYNELPYGSVENAGYFVLEVDGDLMKVKHTSGISKKTPLHN